MALIILNFSLTFRILLIILIFLQIFVITEVMCLMIQKTMEKSVNYVLYQR